MKEYQYMIETPDGETHLIDALNDEEAKSKLSILLNFKFKTEEMEIFDRLELDLSVMKARVLG